MPTFYNLDEIKLYGVPIEIDEAPLNLFQARALVDIVGKIIDEAGHPFKRAVELATEAFRRSYIRTENGWMARSKIHLGGSHGGVVTNKHYKMDRRVRQMARTRSTRARESKTPMRRVMESLQEAGARNNKGDAQAIRDVVRLALGQLSKEQQVSTLKDLGWKLKGEEE